MVLNADAYGMQQLPYSNLGRVNVKGGILDSSPAL